MGFDVTKARDDARVLDLDVAALDRRIPDVVASTAATNAAKARLTGFSAAQERRSIADMLASTRAPARLHSPFLRRSAGILAPGTLPGAARPGGAYARVISALVDDSVLKTTPKRTAR